MEPNISGEDESDVILGKAGLKEKTVPSVVLILF